VASRDIPRSQRQYVSNSAILKTARELPGVRAGPMPGFIGPCMATLWDRPPSGDNWVHEIKLDGYRVQLHLSEGQGVRYFTRRGHDWAPKFGPLVTAAARLKTRQAVIDGEVCIVTPQGRTDFGALQVDLGSGRTDRLVFVAFDLLYLEMFDLRGVALIDRKRLLAELLRGVTGTPIRYSEHLQADGDATFQNACILELEGVVSKRCDLSIVPGGARTGSK
jgi:bifunctional non-homologous end joining protein LigD